MADPLVGKYIVMFLDAIHYNVKKAVNIAIGIRLDGTKEVMGLYIDNNESAKYWLGVLHDLKAKGVHDYQPMVLTSSHASVTPLPLSVPGD